MEKILTTWEQFREQHEKKRQIERDKLKPLFDKAISLLKMERTGKGNNDLHENDKYSLFMAQFPEVHLLLCNKSCTVSLFAFNDEKGLQNMLAYIKNR